MSGKNSKKTLQTETPVAPKVEETKVEVKAVQKGGKKATKAVEAETTATTTATATTAQKGGKKSVSSKATKSETPVETPVEAVVEVKAVQKGGKKATAKKATATATATTTTTTTPTQKGGKKATLTKAVNKVETEGEESNDRRIRSFKVKLPDREEFEGRFTGLTPYQAANKALSKYFRETEKPKLEITFSICESTRKSKKSVYTYVGRRQKLDIPVSYKIQDGREIVKNFKNSLKKVKKSEVATESA